MNHMGPVTDNVGTDHCTSHSELKRKQKKPKAAETIIFHSWRTLFSLINKNNKTYFFLSLHFVWKLTLRVFAILIQSDKCVRINTPNIWPKWFVFTCLLRKLCFHGNRIMRNYIRLQLSHVKPANYMSTNNIDSGISQITIITIYNDKQYLWNEIIDDMFTKNDAICSLKEKRKIF